MKPLGLFANTADATSSLQSDLAPILQTVITVAGAAFLLFLIIGGIFYITSAGNPERLQRAKDVLIKGVIGFVIILAASSITLTLQTAFSQKPNQPSQISNVQFEKQNTDGGIVNDLIGNFIKSAVNDVGKPVTQTIANFLTQTPLMSQTPKVFNIWAIVLAICNVLFVLVVALIGFRVMSGPVFGFDDGGLRQLLPQIIGVFAAMNLSIFLIDFLITIANSIAKALMIGSDNQIFVTALQTLIGGVATLPIGGMILILILVIAAVMLAIYYLFRIVTLYVGAAVSPFVILLWLIPSFRDFAVLAARQYVVTIFILFVHMIILVLATSLIDGVGEGNSFISVLIGITTLLVLIKANASINQTLNAAGVARGARRLSSALGSSSKNFTNNVKEQMSKQETSSSGTGAKPVSVAAGAGGGSVTGAGGGKFKNFADGDAPSVNSAAGKSGGKASPQVTVTRVPSVVKESIKASGGNNFANKSNIGKEK